MRQPKKPKKFVLKDYLKNAIRKLSYKFPSRSEAVNAVRIPAPAEWPNKRVKWVVPCCNCKQLYELSDVQCDHIEPIIPVTGWPDVPKSPMYDSSDGDKDMNILIYRTFVPARKLQVMCKPCHNAKSQSENAQRRLM